MMRNKRKQINRTRAGESRCPDGIEAKLCAFALLDWIRVAFGSDLKLASPWSNIRKLESHFQHERVLGEVSLVCFMSRGGNHSDVITCTTIVKCALQQTRAKIYIDHIGPNIVYEFNIG
jgi:hypothetical protein